MREKIILIISALLFFGGAGLLWWSDLPDYFCAIVSTLGVGTYLIYLIGAWIIGVIKSLKK